MVSEPCLCKIYVHIFHNILSNLLMIAPFSIGQPLVICWLAVNPEVSGRASSAHDDDRDI